MSQVEIPASTVLALLSEPRMAPYRRSAGGDDSRALELYEWGARTSSAAFEVVGHLEVLLRNSLDSCLRRHYREDQCGIPWFLLPTPGGTYVADAVQAVRERLRPQRQETRHQIVAGLSFGFWSGLLGPKYEDLWRECLRHAFPGSTGKRKQVATAVERVRKFRNRLAHHDSIIGLDIPFELRQVLELAAYMDVRAADWLRRCSRVMEVYSQCPVIAEDTVVVPARDAWPLYGSCSAYICQTGRFFRPIRRVAFYADREIKREIPAVQHRRDDVEWSKEEAARLALSEDRFDRKVAGLIAAAGPRWPEGRYQVFLLTKPGDPEHRQLSAALPHNVNGPGSAFVQRQRYVSLHSLENAETTADLKNLVLGGLGWRTMAR